MVDVTKISTKEVVEHLKGFGLTAKSPESLDGGAALGLKLMNKTGKLMFRRGNKIPAIEGEISRRELFSICGKLLGHYPVAGWLWLACSYVKRRASGVDWEDRDDCKTLKVIQEILVDVEKKDPVTGAWHIPETKRGVVWCGVMQAVLRQAWSWRLAVWWRRLRHGWEKKLIIIILTWPS